jgi:hypothetical protein
MGDFNRISLIEASASDPAGAYVAAKRYQMDDRQPYLFKTHDYGKTWTKITEGIAADDFLQAVREDPVRPGLLYAGTEHGIYISFDDGAHWRSLALNLPDTQVADILVEKSMGKNDLVIATHGRSFYVLDDVGLLRQLTPEVTRAPFHLFEPAPAIRPVKPAVIDYYLSKANEKVKIEILDGKGQLVRAFDSAVTPAYVSSDPGDGSTPAGPGSAPSTRAGSNRFVWDLRYPGAITFPGIVLRYATPGEGPTAPPGEYSIRLTVNGATQMRRLTIEHDPRLTDVSDADLHEQFRLAMQIRDETDRAHRGVLEIRSIREQLKQRAQAANDVSLTERSSQIASKLDEVEQDLYQVRNRSPRDTLNYPIKLNNQLAVLQHEVDTGNNRPTDQDYVVLKELSARLDEILARLKAVLAGDLGAFNQGLAAKHVEPVKIPQP